MTSVKCNLTADKLRDEGNFAFRHGEFIKALTLYNESLSHAPSDSQQVALAYANRSAVYFEMKRYERCLENIRLARDHQYDSAKLPKLNEREEKCRKLMKTLKSNQLREEFFQLSYPANAKIPFIVDCIELRQSNKYGRYLVTKQDLHAGDVIAIEEPFYKFIDKECCFTRCANCLSSNDLSLIPCGSCTTTLYCSNDCKSNHETLVHHMECNKKPLAPVLIVCTKMLLTAVTIAGSLDALRDFISDSKDHTVFDYDLSNDSDASHKKNLLRIVNSMAKSEHSKIIITEKMKSIFNFPPFDSLWETDEDRDFLIDCFHSQLRIHNTNQLEMGEYCLVEGDNPYWWAKPFGSGLCPFASLFNHSCDANIIRTCLNNKIVFVAAKPIEAGSQLFLSYGYSSYKIPRDERKMLLKRFSFTCDCEACEKDFPLMVGLPRRDSKFFKPKFISMSVQKAVEEFQRNCQFLNENIKDHPSYETTMTLIHNDHCLNLISMNSFE